MSGSIKCIFVALKFVFILLSVRKFGCIVNEFTQTSTVTKQDLRLFEKLSKKLKKADADIHFLKNCRIFGVFPKFITFKLPNVSSSDTYAIRSRLLKSQINKRYKERATIKLKFEAISRSIKSKLNLIQLYTLHKAVKRNVDKYMKTVIEKHEAKLSRITKNVRIPYDTKDTITNISSYTPTPEQMNLLKIGLGFSIRPGKISKSDILTCFESICRQMVKHLCDTNKSAEIKAHLSGLAHTYVNSYKPSQKDIRNIRILKELKKNKEIVITKPDKGNGIIILDRSMYNACINNIIEDQTKFVKINTDPTLKQEGSLHRFLRSIHKTGELDADTYKRIYPKGSIPAIIYGLTKVHKAFGDDGLPNTRPIISSFGTYNYELAKYLSELIQPHIPEEYTVTDTFTFVKTIKDNKPI
ncbi:uncharacterized protein LOC117106794 [Anneissia japonica]|uniref:uncharacterized protein LOC117106794 n=1 Tax=Anneissia japonica TaxID=1529436 RepID=UPI001425642B|nr:uncharacterized protein LOC117106794 [Anneissia japonica]